MRNAWPAAFFKKSFAVTLIFFAVALADCVPIFSNSTPKPEALCGVGRSSAFRRTRTFFKKSFAVTLIFLQ
jgi:hypothetical protein